MAHDAHHVFPPQTLERPGGPAGEAAPPRTIDWLRVGVWAGVVVLSCAVWAGIGLALYALVVS